MVTKNEVPAAIEGREISVIGQNIKPVGGPKKLPETDEVVYQLKADRRAESTIVKENLPKMWRFKDYSCLDDGDQIAGKQMWGLSSNFIGIGDLEVGTGGRTSAHPGQQLKIFGTCCMVLIKGYKGPAIDVHPKNELLKVGLKS